MKKLILIYFLFLAATSFSQQLVTGNVTNPWGEPIKDVIIGVKDTDFKTFTTDSGIYAFSVPKNKSTLTFQHPD